MARLPEPAQARFWVRYAAWSLDAVCVSPLLWLLGKKPLQTALTQLDTSVHDLATRMSHAIGEALAQGQTPTALAMAWLTDAQVLAAVQRVESALFTLLLLPPAVYAVLACLWSLGFEASAWQATPGKRALGLQVVRLDGRPMTLGVAMKRYLAAGLSWLTLNIGHAMAAFAPFLALHDRLSQTRVIAATPGLPLWARLWLFTQVAGLLLGSVLLWQTLQTGMQAAMNAALGGV